MHDLSADLPPPRDDEPASLRQDIVDELADHLECALRRELLRSGSSGSGETTSNAHNSTVRAAHHNVLTRFGNPAAVARQLWFDAMKERLMIQKITLLLAVVATAAMVFLSVVIWQTLERATEAQRLANETQATLAQQQEQLAASILKSLESFRGASAAPAGIDGWTPLTVKLVSVEGEPVEGEVFVTGTPIGGDKKDVSVSRKTGQNGVAACGMVPYGNYELKVNATAAGETHTEHFMIAPGQPSERIVTCPAEPLSEVEMRFEINPPKELQSDQLRYLISLGIEPRQVGDSEWRQRISYQEPSNYLLWVDASGRILSKTIQRPGFGFARSSIPGLIVMQHESTPELREYTYRLYLVQIGIGEIAANGPEFAAISSVEESVVLSMRGYSPSSAETFQPHAGDDNVWKIDIPDDVWASAFDEFRKSPYARHVTIPDDWATVSIPEDRLGNSLEDSFRYWGERFAFGNPVNIIAWRGFLKDDPRQQSPLIVSARPIARDDPGPVSGFSQEPGKLVLMVTPEQRTAIEELLRIEELHFYVTPADQELETPILHEETLEQLRQVDGGGDGSVSAWTAPAGTAVIFSDWSLKLPAGVTQNLHVGELTNGNPASSNTFRFHVGFTR